MKAIKFSLNEAML